MRTLTVGDVGELFDGPHATPQRLAEGDKYFLNISSLVDGRLDLAKSDRLSDADFEKWTRRVQPRAGDLLFSYETRLGDAALMPEGIEGCLGRRMALLRPDPAVVDSRFLLYAWLSPAFRATIMERSVHGATVSRIPLNELPNWPLLLLGLREQVAVAETLGALDDKIAINRRVQAIARDLAISIAETAERTCPVEELGEISRTALAPSQMVGDVVAHYSLPAYDAGSATLDSPGSIKSAKQLISKPVLLVSKLNPRIPRIWPVDVLPRRTAVASTEFVALQPKEGIPVGQLWAALISPKFTSTLVENVAGTTGSHQRVKPADILACCVSDVRALSGEQRDVLRSACRLTNLLADENQRLAATRDELLPLLIDGRITVKNAEKRVEEEL